MDSCRPRKLDPGLAQMYSKPRDFSTSTMKSEPGRSAVSTSTEGETGPVSSASALAEGAVTARRLAGCCAAAGLVPAASAAAPAAAPFRNRRRLGIRSISCLPSSLVAKGGRLKRAAAGRIAHPTLTEGQFCLAGFFFFDAWSEELFEEAFAHQALHGAV